MSPLVAIAAVAAVVVGAVACMFIRWCYGVSILFDEFERRDRHDYPSSNGDRK